MSRRALWARNRTKDSRRLKLSISKKKNTSAEGGDKVQGSVDQRSAAGLPFPGARYPRT